MEGKEGDLALARKLVLDGLRADPYHGALWTVYAIIERQDGSDGKARKVNSAVRGLGRPLPSPGFKNS